MKKPKKETRDVIAKHVRWTEALRVVRAYHPEVTIILPEEKIQILPGDDVRAAIAPQPLLPLSRGLHRCRGT